MQVKLLKASKLTQLFCTTDKEFALLVCLQVLSLSLSLSLPPYHTHTIRTMLHTHSVIARWLIIMMRQDSLQLSAKGEDQENTLAVTQGMVGRW